MRARVFLGGAVVLVCLTACDRPAATPFSPDIVEQPQQPPPPVSRLAAVATLELSNGVGTSRGSLSWVRFVLRETSGRSGATVKAVYTANDNGRVQVTDEGCWRQVIRVDPGGTQHTFAGEVPDPADPYGSCSPYHPFGPTSQLRVTVSFVDDAGALGTVTASIPTP